MHMSVMVIDFLQSLCGAYVENGVFTVGLSAGLVLA